MELSALEFVNLRPTHRFTASIKKIRHDEAVYFKSVGGSVRQKFMEGEVLLERMREEKVRIKGRKHRV